MFMPICIQSKVCVIPIPRVDIHLYYLSCLSLQTLLFFIAPTFSRFPVFPRAFYRQERFIPHRAFHWPSHFLIIELSCPIVPSLRMFLLLPTRLPSTDSVHSPRCLPPLGFLSSRRDFLPIGPSFHIALSFPIALFSSVVPSFQDSTLTIALFGEFRLPHLMPSEDFTFEGKTPSLQGEDKRGFIEFARRMLKWLPEERATAKELYGDPWLNSP
jgi:hypothetical protein